MPIALLALGALTPRAVRAENSSNRTVVYPDRDADAYVLSHSDTLFSLNVSFDDIKSLKKKKVTGDFLWVRRGGKEFVIRDPGTVEAARRLFDPLEQLDPESDALEAQQEQLEEEESALDEDEEQLESEFENLDDESESQVSDSTRSVLTSRRVELESRMRAFEAKEHELDATERSLEERSEALEQKAEAALWVLVDQAISNGLGQEVRR